MKHLAILLAITCIANAKPTSIKCTDDYDNKYTYTFNANADTLTSLFCVQSEHMYNNNVNPYCKPVVFAYKLNAKWIHDDGDELIIDSTKIQFKSGFTLKCKPVKK